MFKDKEHSKNIFIETNTIVDKYLLNNLSATIGNK